MTGSCALLCAIAARTPTPASGASTPLFPSVIVEFWLYSLKGLAPYYFRQPGNQVAKKRTLSQNLLSQTTQPAVTVLRPFNNPLLNPSVKAFKRIHLAGI